MNATAQVSTGAYVPIFENCFTLPWQVAFHASSCDCCSCLLMCFTSFLLFFLNQSQVLLSVEVLDIPIRIFSQQLMCYSYFSLLFFSSSLPFSNFSKLVSISVLLMKVDPTLNQATLKIPLQNFNRYNLIKNVLQVPPAFFKCVLVEHWYCESLKLFTLN